jgi:hypothetical protein
MPRRQLQANSTPYTKVLSALLKTELVRLCMEFRLPVDGSVVALRLRLKDFLNLNRDTLYRNPRYNALFPRHRRAMNHLPPPLTIQTTQLSHTKSSSSPSALSYKTPSPVGSYDSWNGIEDQPVLPQHPIPGQHHIPLQQPPLPLLHQDPPPQEPHVHFDPPPSPSIAGSDHGLLPPVVHAAVHAAAHAADGRKSSLSLELSFSVHLSSHWFFRLFRYDEVRHYWDVFILSTQTLCSPTLRHYVVSSRGVLCNLLYGRYATIVCSFYLLK